MRLADYQPARVKVPCKGESFEVRGLSLDDIAILMRNHLTDLDSLLALYADNVKSEIAVAATAQYAVTLVREAPGLVSNVLALAMDEPDRADAARRLPLSVQVDALKAIGILTFEESGGPKKFYESLMTLLAGIRPGLPTAGSLT